MRSATGQVFRLPCPHQVLISFQLIQFQLASDHIFTKRIPKGCAVGPASEYGQEARDQTRAAGHGVQEELKGTQKMSRGQRQRGLGGGERRGWNKGERKKRSLRGRNDRVAESRELGMGTEGERSPQARSGKRMGSREARQGLASIKGKGSEGRQPGKKEQRLERQPGGQRRSWGGICCTSLALARLLQLSFSA